MDAHAAELLPFLMWLLVVLGSAFCGLLAWLGNKVVTRLEGIESALKEMKSEHGERIARLEARCETNHG